MIELRQCEAAQMDGFTGAVNQLVGAEMKQSVGVRFTRQCHSDGEPGEDQQTA